MDRFKISTKKSLFKPIETEVDGKVYRVEMVTPELLDKISEYDVKAGTADMKAVCTLLEMVLKVPKAVSKKCDVRDLNQLLEWVSGLIYNPTKYVKEKEKNVSRAGPASSKQ